MSTMSNEEIIKVVQASINGAVIQFQNGGSDVWVFVKDPAWRFHDSKYRVKQLTAQEFIELRIDDGCWDKSYVAACKDILRHIKKLQGEQNASRD